MNITKLQKSGSKSILNEMRSEQGSTKGKPAFIYTLGSCFVLSTLFFSHSLYDPSVSGQGCPIVAQPLGAAPPQGVVSQSHEAGLGHRGEVGVGVGAGAEAGADLT